MNTSDLSQIILRSLRADVSHRNKVTPPPRLSSRYAFGDTACARVHAVVGLEDFVHAPRCFFVEDVDGALVAEGVGGFVPCVGYFGYNMCGHIFIEGLEARGEGLAFS